MRITKSDAENEDHAFHTLDGLAKVVRRLTQEVEVLREVLRERNLWDEQQYKRLIVDRMIHDHSSLGVGSHTSYTHYPYSLDEARFLRYRFKASDQEVTAFMQAVDHISSLT